MTRAATVAFLHGGSHAQLATLADPALEPYRIRPVQVRTGDLDDIRDVDVLVVADRLRPDLLTRWTDTITDCLGRGATVVVFGENNSGDWLPGVREVSRPTVFWWWRTGEDHRLRLRSPDHPAWDYFSEHSVIWHYHGVLEPPGRAVSLVDLHTPRTASATVRSSSSTRPPPRGGCSSPRWTPCTTTDPDSCPAQRNCCALTRP